MKWKLYYILTPKFNYIFFSNLCLEFYLILYVNDKIKNILYLKNKKKTKTNGNHGLLL